MMKELKMNWISENLSEEEITDKWLDLLRELDILESYRKSFNLLC